MDFSAKQNKTQGIGYLYYAYIDTLKSSKQQNRQLFNYLHSVTIVRIKNV